MAEQTPFDGRTPKIRALEKQMNEAAAKRENIAYVFACNALGRNPEYRDLYEQGVAELMRERQKTLENPFYQSVLKLPQQAEPDYSAKRTKISYAEFLKLVDSSSVNPYNAFDETQYSEKMRILKEAGCDNLVIAKGKSIPIGDVKISRVLHAFSNTYKTAMNWAKGKMKQKTGKKIKKPDKLKKQVTGKRKKADTQPELFSTEGRI